MAFYTGKLAPKIHPNLPKAHRYLSLFEAQPPAQVDWSPKMGPVAILGNDSCGDCTIATSLHAIQLWSCNAGKPILPDAQSALADYIAMTGYDPATGANDTGANLLDKDQRWMQVGFAVSENGALDKLDGFAQFAGGDLVTLKKTIAFFGCAEVGVQLPDTAENEFYSHVWADCSQPPNPNLGHDTLAVGYDADSILIATWNGLVRASNAWISKYMDEGVMLLRRVWLEANGLAPSGVGLAALDALISEANGVLAPQ